MRDVLEAILVGCERIMKKKHQGLLPFSWPEELDRCVAKEQIQIYEIH